MIPQKGVLLLEIGLEFPDALLPLPWLEALRAVATHEFDESRLTFVQTSFTWPVILGMAVGIPTRLKEDESETKFRTASSKDRASHNLVRYFLNGPLLMRHWLIAHHLYWVLHPQRINKPWPLPVVVYNFFRLNPAADDATRTTTVDQMGVIHRILDRFPRASQSEAFSVAVGLFRYSKKELNAHYAKTPASDVIAKWIESPTPYTRKPWDQPMDSHWNLSRVWWENCVDYVDAMIRDYDVRFDFSRHSHKAAYAHRQVVAILSLGRRAILYAQEEMELEQETTHTCMDHCLQWMMGTARGSYAEHIQELPTETMKPMYREVLRVLFWRRLDVETQWKADTSHGHAPWAEEEFRGHVIYLGKKNESTKEGLGPSV
jgi:hypothetical protein